MMAAMRGMTVPPPATDDTSSLALFRSLLETAPFEAGSIQELLGTESGVLTRPRDYPVHLRRIATDESALAMLTRLFLLLAEVDVVSADQALAPLGVEGLERLRLVETLDDRVRATVRIVPHGRLVLASDLPGLVGAEHVAGIHGPSATLGHLTVRRPVARALDVATGSGIQALLAARHAERVVATDVNERALAFAAFNAAVNGVDNVELRHGSFFEPVHGERFGLVVCNPPYVVSPDSEYLFRDSGLGGDRVSSELVGALPSLLEDGAFGSIMVSWIQDEVDEPADRPRRWLEGSGCDAWILHSSTDDALATAAGWHRDAATADEYGERIDRWLDYYRREGIGAVSYGAIVMRRRVGGGNWVRSTRLPSGRVGPADAHLRRLFAAQDALADLTRRRTARPQVGPRRSRGARAGARRARRPVGATLDHARTRGGDRLPGRSRPDDDGDRASPRRRETAPRGAGRGRRRARGAARRPRAGRCRPRPAAARAGLRRLRRRGLSRKCGERLRLGRDCRGARHHAEDGRQPHPGVMVELGVHSRAQAVAEAYRLCLVNGDFEGHSFEDRTDARGGERRIPPSIPVS